MTLIATCHCGQTKIEVANPPAEAKQCNCTYCSRTGAVWGYYKPSELTFVSRIGDTSYSASGVGNEHHFCSKCGMQTWGESPDWGSMYNDDGTPKNGAGGMPTERIAAINLRLIDDFDWSKVTIQQMDGRNAW